MKLTFLFPLLFASLFLVVVSSEILDFSIESPQDKDIISVSDSISNVTDLTIQFSLGANQDKVANICFEMQSEERDGSKQNFLQQTCIPKGLSSITISDISANKYNLIAFAKGYNEDEMSAVIERTFQVNLISASVSHPDNTNVLEQYHQIEHEQINTPNLLSSTSLKFELLQNVYELIINETTSYAVLEMAYTLNDYDELSAPIDICIEIVNSITQEIFVSLACVYPVLPYVIAMQGLLEGQYKAYVILRDRNQPDLFFPNTEHSINILVRGLVELIPTFEWQSVQSWHTNKDSDWASLGLETQFVYQTLIQFRIH